MNAPYNYEERVCSFSNICFWQPLVEVIYINYLLPLTPISTPKLLGVYLQKSINYNRIVVTGEYKAYLIRNSAPIGSKIKALSELSIGLAITEIVVTCPSQ